MRREKEELRPYLIIVIIIHLFIKLERKINTPNVCIVV